MKAWIAGLLVVAAQAVTADKPIVIPFEPVTRHVVMSVSVNGKPLSFILDTGDKFAIVDMDRAKALGLSFGSAIKIGGVGSEAVTGAFVRDAAFSVPGLPQFAQPISIAMPLNTMAGKMGHDFDGIIGHDFIAQFVVEIDYRAKEVRLHNKDTFSYSGPGEIIPIEINGNGHAVVDAEVTAAGRPPVKGKFTFDIGSGAALSLHSPFVKANGLPGEGVKTIKALGIGGAGGSSSGRIGRVAALKLGRFTFTGVTTFFSADETGAFANAAVAGNIGAQIATRFRLFLDYGRKRIILEPLDGHLDPFDHASSGIVLSTDAPDFHRFRIDEVLEGSPAAERNLQPGDILAAVNDRPASELTLTSILELFEKPVPYKLTISRGNATLNVALTPRVLY